MKVTNLFQVLVVLLVSINISFAQNFNENTFYRFTTQWQGEGKSLDVVNDGKNNKIQLAKTGSYSGQFWKITELSNNSGNNSPQVKVNAHLKCQVVMIDANKLNSPGGWWGKWHELKQAKAYKETPCSFSGLKPSTYVLVAYNPASVNYDPNNGNPAEAADGVVLEKVVIKADSKLNYNFKANDFKIWNCLSCPWLYAYNGNEYVRLTEVIQDVVGEENCQTTSHQISPEYIVDNKIKFRIQEEKDETSYLDRISLTVDGKTITPVKKELTQKDRDYLILEKGESIDLEFDLTGYNAKDHKIILEVNGFYIPKMEFLDAVFDHYLYTK